MNSLTVALIVFASVFSGALIGLYLHSALPEHHFSADSKDVIKLATGLVATISALVLSLLISSAKGSFDRINEELLHSAANIVQLDRTLASYGPETQQLRDAFRRHYISAVDALASTDKAKLIELDTSKMASRVEALYVGLLQLKPRDESQQALKARAIHLAAELSAFRSLLVLQKHGSISMPLLCVLVAWLTMIFMAFGLFAPRNPTVIAALGVSALCASAAVLLILEMDEPFSGLIRFSMAPLHEAVIQLGR